MTPSDEFTPQEQDGRNQRLFQNLRRFYSPRSERETALEQARQWLFSARGLGHATQPGPPPLQHPTLHRQQERASMMNKRTTRSARTWPRRFGTLAATIVVALLVGTLLLVLNSARQSRTGAPGGSTLASPSLGEAGITLRMVDATNGWALTSKAVLLTTDGGVHWKDVTPPGQALVSGSTADFLTTALAWIALPQAGKSTTAILRTSDSGRSWQQSTVQVSFVKQITFIDAQHGWLLTGLANAAGAPAESVSVLRTLDGGKTWQSVATALFSDTTPPGNLPYGGQKSGIHFLSASTGWITGTVTANDLAWLYVTHDGGSTWYQQMLPKPNSVPSAQLSIQPPTFFSASDGILPVRFSDPTTGTGIATVIYVTHDGGATWKPTAPVLIPLGVAAFPNVQYGWVTDGNSLFATSDGGQHWVQRTARTSFKEVTALDFVSSTVGWAVGSQGVLKTTDGGQTWVAIPLSLI